MGQGLPDRQLHLLDGLPAATVRAGLTYTPTCHRHSRASPPAITVDALGPRRSARSTAPAWSPSTAAGSGGVPRQPGRQRQLQRRHPGAADRHGLQGQPDRQLHLDRPGRGRWSAAPPTPRRPPSTSGLTPAITVDASSTDDLLDHRRRGLLHRRRFLRARRQPGRQRQLQRRHPGAADRHRRQGQPDRQASPRRPSGSATAGGATYTPTATRHLGPQPRPSPSTPRRARSAPSPGAWSSLSSPTARASSTPTRPATPTTTPPRRSSSRSASARRSQTITFTFQRPRPGPPSGGCHLHPRRPPPPRAWPSP